MYILTETEVRIVIVFALVNIFAYIFPDTFGEAMARTINRIALQFLFAIDMFLGLLSLIVYIIVLPPVWIYNKLKNF